MTLRTGTALLVFLWTAQVARADLFEWRDENGVRHFTNQAELVPAAAANVKVTRFAKSVLEPAVPVAAPAPKTVQVVSDRDWRSGYEAGFAAAAASGAVAAAPDVRVELNGPLAVVDSGPQASVAVSGPAFVPYGPFVTTSFDRGRSRHRTLRMLLQDQFQIDRDGPYSYERLPVGVGPSFRAFLPRGLTHHTPRGAWVTRR